MNVQRLSFLRATLPVAFGYVPLGVAFGVLFSGLGVSWLYATAMALFVCSGAAQYLSVSLIAAHAGLLDIALATLFLNLRHMFYGLALLDRFKGPLLPRLYLIHALTDETFSLLTSRQNPDANRDCTRDPPLSRFKQDFLITATDEAYWVAGCTLGALFGRAADVDTRGLDFSLTALFVVLFVEQWRQAKRRAPFAVALAAGLASLAALHGRHFLLVALAFAVPALLFLPESTGPDVEKALKETC